MYAKVQASSSLRVLVGGKLLLFVCPGVSVCMWVRVRVFVCAWVHACTNVCTWNTMGSSIETLMDLEVVGDVIRDAESNVQ